ncbi:MAG: hypothetical protein H6618_05775 [Deltaproteobacteria bacterium]|nr:hypothetical protein [Deltaproteobacteria bacterium]
MKRVCYLALFMIFCLSGNIRASEICKREYERWQKFEDETRLWANVSAATGTVGTAVGATFLSPVGGGCLGILTGVGPGAVAFRYHQMSKGAKEDYETCVEEVRRHNEEKRAKNDLKYNEELKQKQQKEYENANTELEETNGKDTDIDQKLQEMEV